MRPPASEPIRAARDMVAAMNPALDPDEFVFCSSCDPSLIANAEALALGSFREAEGVTLILPRGAAEALGFSTESPMRRIVLTVNSALDGVGLTAAVASALAAEGIPCNVVAAFHHDHVFAPSEMAERALAALEALQVRSASPR